MLRRILPFLLLIFASCHPLKHELEKSGVFKDPHLKLEDVVNSENTNGSRDISFHHFVAIGEDLYPNQLGYNLTSVKTFLRKADLDINFAVNYWSSNDDSIRAVLYEWTSSNQAAGQNDTTTIDTDNLEEKILKLDGKFVEFEKEVSSVLGNPTFKLIDTTNLVETKRDDIKWQYSDKLKVYLLMFKNPVYRQIRLIAYKN